MITKEEIESLGFTWYVTLPKTINTPEESELYVALSVEYDRPVILRYYRNEDILMIKTYSGPTNISREYKLYYDVIDIDSLKAVLEELSIKPIKVSKVVYNPGY